MGLGLPKPSKAKPAFENRSRLVSFLCGTDMEPTALLTLRSSPAVSICFFRKAWDLNQVVFLFGGLLQACSLERRVENGSLEDRSGRVWQFAY